MGPVSNEFFDGFSAEERIQGKTTHHPKKEFWFPRRRPLTVWSAATLLIISKERKTKSDTDSKLSKQDRDSESIDHPKEGSRPDD